MAESVEQKFARVAREHPSARIDIDRVRGYLSYVERLEAAGVLSDPKFSVSGPMSPTSVKRRPRLTSQI